MSNPEHIHRALKAIAPAGITFYDDEAPATAEAPWLVGSLAVPQSRRNLAGGAHGGTTTWWVTVAASTAAQARVWAQKSMDAWGGARVVVDGYSSFALVHDYSNGPYPAGLTATDTNLRFQVVRLGFGLVASQVAAT